MGKRIWFRDFTLEEVNRRGRGTMVEHLQIEMTELGADFLRGTMPVDHRTKQPEGLLHGGASAALAETLASTAANLCVDHQLQYCVGLEINANHISGCREGIVTGTSSPVHIGKTTQVWETRIHQDKRLVCISRMTLAVLSRKK